MAEKRSQSAEPAEPVVLWWSRSGRDYSRDRIIRRAFRRLGWRVCDFRPQLSPTADWEARLRRLTPPSLIWVPCFRQRDAAAALRWGARHQVPVVMDPLISAWDKQVFERRKFAADSRAARRLLRWESDRLNASAAVVADTWGHAQLFESEHRVSRDKLQVIPVSAEESLFRPAPVPRGRSRKRVLFYGSFIGLQGPEHITKAACQLEECDWLLIGDGPLTSSCRRIAANSQHIRFRSNVPYAELGQAIADSDIVMGIFGDSAKASRVIPNKVYQAMACGRPIVTRSSDAYPSALLHDNSEQTGITWTRPATPQSIVTAVRQLLDTGEDGLTRIGQAAYDVYKTHFSEQAVSNGLAELLVRTVPRSDHGQQAA